MKALVAELEYPSSRAKLTTGQARKLCRSGEMADALASGASGRNLVGVRLSPPTHRGFPDLSPAKPELQIAIPHRAMLWCGASPLLPTKII